MKGLLIKDLKIYAKQKSFLLFVLLLSAFLTFSSDGVVFSANYTILILSIMALSTLSYDEVNGGMLFLLSLPSGRKTYVKEKYVFAFLTLMSATLFAFVLCVTAAMIKQSDQTIESLAVSIIGITFLMGVMLSVALPLNFKFGAEKGRLIVSIAVAGIAVIGISFYTVLERVLHIDLLGALTKLFAGVESEAVLCGIIIGGLFAVMLLVVFFSYLISSRIMEKKEF